MQLIARIILCLVSTAFLLTFELMNLAAEPGAALALAVDQILVFKKEHRLELVSDGKVVRSYPIRLGRRPAGAKMQEGDGRTPEGRYVIDGHNEDSVFHLALHISYPNAVDAARARALGVPPGGAIEIHGLPGWQPGAESLKKYQRDWTEGCVAVGNSAIEEIWDLVPDGTPIEIRP